jgi:acetyl-CoA carboxylase carboxyl transferase subunit beta
MSMVSWIEDQRKNKTNSSTPAIKTKKSEQKTNQGLWTRCDNCGVILYVKHLKENQSICFGCGFHLQMMSKERIAAIIDTGSWRPFDEILSPCDPLFFVDQKNYKERLTEAQEKTGLQDGIQTGTGLITGIPVALGVMNFQFMGGSMGSVVGEKITRLIEYATREGLPLILICASGGARMQEGILSLMQMAKISAALHIYQSHANLLYISILTSPTTGGVTASFGMLGDLILAEPKSLIGFAGRRVIEQTLQEQLPDTFQTAEYLLHHGLLDLIVPRFYLKQAISETIGFYKDAPLKKNGVIPYGIQRSIYFLTEEKTRRNLLVTNKEKEFIEKKNLYDKILKSFQNLFDKNESENSLNNDIQNLFGDPKEKNFFSFLKKKEIKWYFFNKKEKKVLLKIKLNEELKNDYFDRKYF